MGLLLGTKRALLAGYPATRYYVDATLGNDANDGKTPDLAWETIAKVNAATFNPGESILFKRGETWREQLTVPSSGIAGKPITFGAYGSGASPKVRQSELLDGWGVYFDVGGVTVYEITPQVGEFSNGVIEDGARRTYMYVFADPETNLEDLTCCRIGWTVYYRKDGGAPVSTEVGRRKYGIYVNDKSNIIIENIDLDGPSSDPPADATDPVGGIYVTPGSSNIIIKNCVGRWATARAFDSGTLVGGVPSGPTNLRLYNVTATDNQGTGIYFRGSGIVRNCISHGNGQLEFDTGDRAGIGVQGGTDLLVENNEIYDLGPVDLTNSTDFAISVWAPAGSVTISKNYIHDITSGAIQIESDDGSGADDHLIVNNLIDGYGTADDVGVALGRCAAIRILRTDDVKIYHNTITNGGTGTRTNGIFAQYSALNLDIKNNIFFDNDEEDIWIHDGATATGFDSDNNDFHKDDYTSNWYWLGVGYDTLGAWQAAQSQDADSLVDDPLFVGAADFHLLVGSPCRGAGAVGTGVTEDYDGVTRGSPPDIGAFQYVA